MNGSSGCGMSSRQPTPRKTGHSFSSLDDTSEGAGLEELRRVWGRQDPPATEAGEGFRPKAV